ncbi:hypothetical protein AVEN_41535-1 [Araneus ventricosus]|uniref:Uncharacterized protein n=1 Tax=Araneus ventricosus TaxID=182803 RepID=A0A4Y2P653_ARAVE|nr:hypothetical protein AVEN_41535-1 [Araneus ventricosus]
MVTCCGMPKRDPARPGHLGGVDKKLTDKEERARLRAVSEENRRIKYVSASTSSASYEPLQEYSSSNYSKNMDSGDFPTLIESSKPGTNKSVMMKDFTTPKLVVALDRCQVPDVVALHSDGKLLPALSARKSKEERLPIVISYEFKEQLIAVPRLDNSTRKEQAQAFWKAILDWNLEDKVQILCCDSTTSNTGSFNGACALLEQNFDREMLFFSCRHRVYELVLKTIFEVKIKKVTTSPDIPLFKKLKDNWKNIDLTKIQCYRETMELFRSVPELEDLCDFYRAELKNLMVRDDYRELIELTIVFLGGDAGKNLKSDLQVPCMAQAIYSLKLSLFSSQLKLKTKDKEVLLDIFLFIVTIYVQPLLQFILTVKAPYKDLCFLKCLKTYENVNESI